MKNDPKVTSLNSFFCPTDVDFTVINDKEKQQNFTFKEPYWAEVWRFCLKNGRANQWIITVFSTNQLMVAALTRYWVSLRLKTLVVHVLQSKSRGQDLFDQIMYHIDLVETDYFGLQFMDTEQVSVSNKLLRISPVDCPLRQLTPSFFWSLAALAGYVEVYQETDPR